MKKGKTVTISFVAVFFVVWVPFGIFKSDFN